MLDVAFVNCHYMVINEINEMWNKCE